MNLSNSDREFFENLNKDLADSIGSMLSRTKSSNGGGGGGGGDDDDDSKKGGIGKQILGGILKGIGNVAGFGLDVAAKQLKEAADTSIKFGDILARSTVATNRTQLLGKKTIDAQGEVIRGLPQISNQFGKFGFSMADAAKSVDAAIRANIRDTGATAQKFLATSQGLGTSLATTTGFLATQTNVLGKSTEASTEFGNSILGLASSNGILADSILEAVEAFTQANRRQTALFGEESAAVALSFATGAEGMVTDAGMQEMIQALVNPENALMMRAMAGRMGVDQPGDLRDPQQMNKFIGDMLDGFHRFSKEIQNLDVVTQQIMTDQLTQDFGTEFFSLMNQQRIGRLGDALAEKGMTFADLPNFQALSDQELADKQKQIGSTSVDALENQVKFNLQKAFIPSYLDATETMQGIAAENMPTAEKLREEMGGAMDLYATVDVPARIVGTSADELGRSLLDAAKDLGKWALAVGGASESVRRFKRALDGKKGTPKAPGTPRGGGGGGGKTKVGGPGQRNWLNPKAPSTPGAADALKGTPKSPGFFSRTFSKVKGFGDDALKFASKNMNKAAFALKGAKAVPIVGAFAPLGEEYLREDGNMIRGFVRAIATAGGSYVAGAAVGAGGTATTGVGGVPAGLAVQTGTAIVIDSATERAFNALFGIESNPEPEPYVVPDISSDEQPLEELSVEETRSYRERQLALAMDTYNMHREEIDRKLAEGPSLVTPAGAPGGLYMVGDEAGLSNR